MALGEAVNGADASVQQQSARLGPGEGDLFGGVLIQDAQADSKLVMISKQDPKLRWKP